jgi:hypothetical protein
MEARFRGVVEIVDRQVRGIRGVVGHLESTPARGAQSEDLGLVADGHVFEVHVKGHKECQIFRGPGRRRLASGVSPRPWEIEFQESKRRVCVRDANHCTVGERTFPKCTPPEMMTSIVRTMTRAVQSNLYPAGSLHELSARLVQQEAEQGESRAANNSGIGAGRAVQ